MPRTCTICSHPKRKEIEKALVAGTSKRAIARQFHVGSDALLRHKDHVAETIQKAKDAGDIKRAVSLTDQLEELRVYTQQILDHCLNSGQILLSETALKAIARREKQIEIAAKLAGEFKEDAKNPANERVRVERAIEQFISEAANAGETVTKEDAIRFLAPQIPEIHEYVN